MSSDDATLEAAERIIVRINKELIRVLALQQMWSRCRVEQDVLTMFGGNALKPGFLVVRDALHIDLISSLVRLYDDPKRYIPASVPMVVKKLRHPGIGQRINGTPERRRARERALALYDQGDQQRRDALRTLRDRVLAHNDLDRVEHGVRYGDEVRLVAETIEIVSEADRVISGQTAQFTESNLTWKWLADAFWQYCASPSA